jgi:phosphohistidine phosphatase SixA
MTHAADHARAHATEMGNIHARIVGRGLRSSDCTPHFVYVSPALRCVQTATAVTRDMHTLLRVEPALFEWIGDWLAGELQRVGPAFLTVSVRARE